MSFHLPLLLAAEEQIPLNAERLPMMEHSLLGAVLTNSVIVGLLVLGLILWVARSATGKMQLVPNRTSQNTFEAVVEALYNMLEGIVGKHMVARAFPLLATFFIYILASNLFGLIPGVGTIGWGHASGPLSLDEMHSPLLRPTNADLNTTLAMALLFMVFWLLWSFQEMGVGGFFYHIFGPKGNVTGWMKYPLMLIFAFVGIIEVVSILFRPVSLSLRLFGNVYAGDNLLHTMSHLGDIMGMPAFIRIPMSILVPVPFYFLELLVAFVQALVFTLLCAVYIQLSTTHEEGHGGEHAHDDVHAPASTAGGGKVAAVPVRAH